MANARELVLKGLYRIEEQGAYTNKALSDIQADAALPPEDRRFVTELLLGVVQNKLYLDYVIGLFSKVKLKKLSPWVHGILRMGIYQILLMERVPDSAACNESVKLAAKYAHGAARGFVNGVLRSVAREKANLPEPSEPMERLSVRYSCPRWLTEKLVAQYGAETCEQILAASLMPHPTSLRVNTLKTTAEELRQTLLKEGVATRMSETDPRCLYLEGALQVQRSAAYQAGLYTLQNTSSMAAVYALAPKSGERVLDLCAAPGGKTTFAAELMENCGEILACDLHPHKIPLIAEAAKRLGLTIVSAQVHDGTVYEPSWEAAFDRVLADVPCSGIGVIHKKPDIKWKRQSEDIPALCVLQRQVLQNAGRYVKPGGTLVYATCTILREENQEQTAWFRETMPNFTMIKERQILTHQTGGSGFYIAEFARK